MTAQQKSPYSMEQYLQLERSSEDKHEYYDGDMFVLAGTSERHNRIAVNILANLHGQLRRQPCRVYSSDMRIKIPQVRAYTYPDISLVCGKPLFDDEEKDTLLNPIVIFEILSPSTERYDRGKKFSSYRTISTLQEYILVSQDKISLEHYIRQTDNQWLLIVYTHKTNVATLNAIQCQLLLEDIYDDVSVDVSDIEEA